MDNLKPRQQEIVNAALGIISTRGLQALTIKAISDRVGFRDAAVYRHFRSKEHILAAIVGILERNSHRVLKAIDDAAIPPLEKIGLFFIDRCQSFAADRTLTAVLFSDELLRNHRQLAKRMRAVIESHQEILLGFIRQGQRDGVIVKADPEHLFLMLMGSLRFLVTRWQAAEYSFDLIRSGRALWRSLRRLIEIPDRRI